MPLTCLFCYLFGYGANGVVSLICLSERIHVSRWCLKRPPRGGALWLTTTATAVSLAQEMRVGACFFTIATAVRALLLVS